MVQPRFAVTQLIQLPSEQAHIWLAHPDEITDPSRLEAYRVLMSPEEAARQARYIFEHNRHEFLITRALVRITLSRYAPVAPAAWTFRANAYGRPEIATPHGLGLSFNLSNTTGLVACIVAARREVGIDVEDTTRRGQTVEIADRFFAAAEITALRALPIESQRARFFDYWTLKEAYIKARGLGLAIPLEHFAFLLEPGRPVAMTADPRLGDDPARWQFAQFRPTPRHAMAAAVERKGGDEVEFVVRRGLTAEG